MANINYVKLVPINKNKSSSYNIKLVFKNIFHSIYNKSFTGYEAAKSYIFSENNSEENKIIYKNEENHNPKAPIEQINEVFL